MTPAQSKVLHDYFMTSAAKEDVLAAIPQRQIDDFYFVSTNLLLASASEDVDFNNAMLQLYWLTSEKHRFEREFNLLLKHKYHYQHQRMLKHLQDTLRYESTVPIITEILQGDLDQFFAYTGSNLSTIAQWFSYALVEIGTESAYSALRHHANAKNEALAAQMNYQLHKRTSEKRDRP